MIKDYTSLSSQDLAQEVLRRRQELGLDYRSVDVALGLLQEMNVVDWPDKIEYVLAYWHGSRCWRVIALTSECIEWEYPDVATPAQACCLAWLMWDDTNKAF